MNRILSGFSNPVLVKEFRQRWRTVKTPLIIAFYLLAVGGMSVFLMYQEIYLQGFIEIGRSKPLFIGLALVQMALIAFVTPGLSAGTVSGERERQTLNLLLTTHLSPASIVIGKLLASVSFILLLIVATLPIYALVLLYGGISPLQLLEVFGLFILTVLFCASFGILCSVWFKRTSVSTVVAYGFLFVFLAGSLFLSVELEQLLWNGNRYPNHPFLQNNLFLNSLPVIFQSLNPAMMLVELFEPRRIPNVPRYPGSPVLDMWVTDPWPIFLSVFPLLILLFLALGVYLLHPVRPKPAWWRRKSGNG